MTDTTPSADTSPTTPLERAQRLIADLRARAASQPQLDGAFKTDLDNLAAAVSALAPSADPSQTVTSPSPSPSETGGEQLHALRAHLAAVMDQNASFTSLMVHEIRKPMTSIRGYSDMLAKPGLIGPLNDMQTQFVGIIRNNIINMEGLVSNISDLNKLMSGRMQLENKMTTFGQVVMDVQKQFDALAQELGNTLTYEVPQGLPILIADAKQLAKVIGHLVRNAVHYTPKGGQIILRAAKTEDEKLRVSIIDTGIGMKPEELARLGEPFFRADDPLVTGFKGYGLGVPVSARFLELMNSKLTFQSEFGKGTTASFVLESMTQA